MQAVEEKNCYLLFLVINTTEMLLYVQKAKSWDRGFVTVLIWYDGINENYIIRIISKNINSCKRRT